MTLTATVTTKTTSTGRLYTVTLSDGTVATRNSTKEKAAILLYATGAAQTGCSTIVSAKAGTLVAKAYQYGAPCVVVDLATGRVLAQGGAPATAPAMTITAKVRRTAAQDAAWIKFTGAPERLARQMDRDVAFWGADHPSSPAWAAISTAARALTSVDLAEVFAAGARTMGDLEEVLERRLGVRG